jgi:hypothetical protein
MKSKTVDRDELELLVQNLTNLKINLPPIQKDRNEKDKTEKCQNKETKLKPSKPIQSVIQIANIKAENPEAAFRFNLLLEGGLIFKPLDDGTQPFKVEVKRTLNKNNKFDVRISDNTKKDPFYVEFFKGGGRADEWKDFAMNFKEMDEVWIGCGKDTDYFDIRYPCYIGNSALFIKGNICVSVSSDVRQFRLQDGEKVVRYISTVDDKLKVSGFIQTNLGYYGLDSFNSRNGFLPKIFVGYGDEFRFNLRRWANIYPYGHVKKIKVKIIIPPVFLPPVVPEPYSHLKKWFSK